MRKSTDVEINTKILFIPEKQRLLSKINESRYNGSKLEK